MSSETKAQDGIRVSDAAALAAVLVGPQRRVYAAPRLQPLGRVAELMRGSVAGITDGHNGGQQATGH